MNVRLTEYLTRKIGAEQFMFRQRLRLYLTVFNFRFVPSVIEQEIQTFSGSVQ